MLRILILSIAILLPLSAAAQDGAIKIIREDGSVDVFEIPGTSAPAPEKPSPVFKRPSVPKVEVPKASVAVPEKPAVVLKPKVEKAAPVQTSAVPKPKRKAKPPAPRRDSPGRVVKARTTIIPEGAPVTRDLALRVALDVAPPARSYRVMETIYKDRPAFQIRFKTENGPHDVVIDAENGKVLKR